MQAERYFIKDGYQINDTSLTLEDVSGEEYWDESRNYGAYFYQFPVYQYATQLIDKYNVKSITDVGCGAAIKLNWLHGQKPDISYCGVDQEHVIRYCKQKYQFGEWYADNFEAPDPSLNIRPADLVICSDVVEHVDNPHVLLNYLKTRLNPGGIILLSTPERDLLRGADCMHSPNRYHVREWNQDELNRFLEHTGFEIAEHFCQLPMRIWPNKLTLLEIVPRVLKGRPIKYNQVCVLKPQG